MANCDLAEKRSRAVPARFRSDEAARMPSVSRSMKVAFRDKVGHSRRHFLKGADMLKAISTTVVFGLLTGCGGIVETPEEMTRRFSTMTPMQLCQTHAQGKQIGKPSYENRTRMELERRKALSSRDISDIASGKIRQGMRDYVSVCSWGPYVDINSTVVGGFNSTQYVMVNGRYVYTRNGRVYGWQQ